jgi:hypothetical protein
MEDVCGDVEALRCRWWTWGCKRTVAIYAKRNQGLADEAAWIAQFFVIDSVRLGFCISESRLFLFKLKGV